MSISATADPPDTAEADAGARWTAREWGALIVLCGALFLDALDVSMMGVALPSIREDLGLSTRSLQWVVSGYVLGYGGFLLLGGRAADLLGRRRMFLAALAVFTVASGLGGFATNGELLIASRFITGVAAAFTAPAGLSIITTTFPEGAARNRALSIYTATGATGFSLGLVVGGILTEGSWRLVFFVPVVLAFVTLLAAVRLVRDPGTSETDVRRFDVGGAVTLTAAMLLLVFTVVEAPEAGWGSAATLGGVVGTAALLAAFVAIERRSSAPLVRLGILRSASLIRANVGAMALFGSWLGFQFVATLYFQQLRGWSASETGLALFPAGLIVAVFATRIEPLIARFGLTKVILAGLVSVAASYALFLPIGHDSGYVVAVLPTVLLAGIGFALAYGPLNIAATNGVDAHEQGLAGGLVITSFQFGGALVLAVVTAVNEAVGTEGSADGLLDGFRAALLVPLVVAVLGIAVTAGGLSRRAAAASAPAVAPVIDLDAEEELVAVAVGD